MGRWVARALFWGVVGATLIDLPVDLRMDQFPFGTGNRKRLRDVRLRSEDGDLRCALLAGMAYLPRPRRHRGAGTGGLQLLPIETFPRSRSDDGPAPGSRPAPQLVALGHLCHRLAVDLLERSARRSLLRLPGDHPYGDGGVRWFSSHSESSSTLSSDPPASAFRCTSARPRRPRPFPLHPVRSCVRNRNLLQVPRRRWLSLDSTTKAGSSTALGASASREAWRTGPT